MASEKATSRGPSAASWATFTPEERDDEMRAIAESQADSRAHLEAILSANRKLRRFLRAHALDGARAWQYQVGLFTVSDYSDRGEWGVTSHVVIWCPDIQQQDHRVRWGKTWRSSIAAAVEAVLHDEP